MLTFSAFIVALVITIILIPPLIGMAQRLALLDTPDERKVHSTAIPRLGGIAMVAGALLPILFWMPSSQTSSAFVAALLVLLVFGAWDDAKDIDYKLKFAGQFFAVGLVVVWGGVTLSVLPFAGFEAVPDYLAVPVTIIFLVGVTNAVNLSDGLDGLAAGVALLSLAAISVLAKLADGFSVIFICFVVAGTIFGFLRYNTYPAVIFMGDTGSQFLGFTIGVLTVLLTQQTNTALNPLLPLFLVGLPILDTLFVMVKRIMEGRSPFAADKSHMHHRLLSLGMKHYEAVAIIYVAQLMFLGAAYLLRYQSDIVVAVTYIGLSGLILGGILALQARQPELNWGRLTGLLGRIDRHHTVQRISYRLIEIGVPAYLLLGVLQVSEVPADIQISSLILLAFLVIRLAWHDRLRFVSLRLLVFPGIAFAVYLMHNDAPLQELLSPTVSFILLIVLLLLMFLVIRTTRDQRFQTTPTDLLVVALIGGAGLLYQQGLVRLELVPVILGIAVLFYASEMILRHMERTWNAFTIGTLAILTILSLKF